MCNAFGPRGILINDNNGAVMLVGKDHRGQAADWAATNNQYGFVRCEPQTIDGVKGHSEGLGHRRCLWRKT